MIDAVHRYDGYVVQSTGDGIFALFGAPVAHEDHPQRALYAALRMQEELRRYAATLRERGRAPIEIRIGVNTGEVVVRAIKTAAGHAEYTPIGHTTNLASRMQTRGRYRNDRRDRGYAQALRGLLHVPLAGTDAGQGRERGGQCPRGYGPRSAAYPAAGVGAARAFEVRRPRAPNSRR